MQLLVYDVSDFVELLCVVSLHRNKPALYRLADGFQFLLVVEFKGFEALFVAKFKGFEARLALCVRGALLFEDHAPKVGNRGLHALVQLTA
ncbi:hypothetical protein SDC9_207881 [bioreactor metagenome]|uniref:Uncharacterized protein n=1 Tax=bioreactor metagenome TaxID=1076179 RepID=A0A645J9Q4_9ZZZZ